MTMEKLFTEFDPVTPQQWKDQLVKDLKGIDFSQLVWHTDNGFDVNPFYTAEDLPAASGPVFTHHDWHIGELIIVNDEREANRAALAALNGGVSCLKFCLDGNRNLTTLLDGIYIEHIATEFMLNSHLGDFEKQFNDILSARSLSSSNLRVAVNYDILAHLVEQGNWLSNRAQDLGDVLRSAGLPFNSAKLLVDATLYQNTGAGPVTELAMVLGHYHEYLAYLKEQGFDLQALAKGVQVSVAVGSDFFMEIAKLRALRQLMPLVNRAYGVEAPLFVSCTTSRLTFTSKDPYTNLLRSTTQAMSAVIGGCDALYVTPFSDQPDPGQKAFAERMARNQQLILKEESYLNKAADIGAGSYYIESLTEQLATRAFDLFKSWEAQGGWLACLEKGIVQSLVSTQVAVLKEKAASGDLTIIGANKYMNPDSVAAPVSNRPASIGPMAVEPIRAIRLAEAFE